MFYCHSIIVITTVHILFTIKLFFFLLALSKTQPPVYLGETGWHFFLQLKKCLYVMFKETHLIPFSWYYVIQIPRPAHISTQPNQKQCSVNSLHNLTLLTTNIQTVLKTKWDFEWQNIVKIVKNSNIGWKEDIMRLIRTISTEQFSVKN